MRNNPKFTIFLVLGALLLLGAAPASATPPSWYLPSGTLYKNDPNFPEVLGFLIPNSGSTTCVVQYGETTSYGFQSNCVGGPFSGTSVVTTPAFLSGVNGLFANTTYHFRFVATNSDGSAATRDASFTTTTGPPQIVRPMPLFITDSFATVGSLIKPNGSPLTSCVVQYGLTTAYGNQVDCQQQPIDDAEIDASADLSNLTNATTYHFRIVAQNALGTRNSADASFTTCAVAQDPPTGDCS